MQHFRNDYVKLVAALCVLACLLAGRQSMSAVSEQAALTAALANQIKRPDNFLPALAMDWTYLERLYSLRHYAPVWTSNSGPNPRASVLRQFLHVADLEGLNPSAFHLSAIESSWHRRSPDDLAALDILLSDAFFRYATQVRVGRLLPEDVDPQWHLGAPTIQPVSLLQKMLASADFETALRGLAPQQFGYQRLREALAHYRQLAANGGWPLLAQGTSLREGMSSTQIPLLRRRLIAEGDMQETPVADTRRFDPAVKFAVDRFQVRHGLKVDGIVGPATRAAMNVPIANRITQIKLNMERWRWLPHELGERYLIVNTAGYDLTAFEHGQARFSMWVVIGKQDRQTPEIEGSMHTVVFNPYWTVPTTIAVEDLIPAQLRNPNYLQRHKIRVFASLAKQITVNPRQIDWAEYTKENFPFVLRQDPGPYNPLGRYKFLFSNEFDVYLHDTPARQLFSQKQRTFSSGCIRVENPLQLATFLLALNSGWDEAHILKAVATGQTSEVKLAKSLPIYLVYLTAWVGPDKSVYFYPDVYQRDEPIAHCVSPNSHPERDNDLPCMP
jgi:murein L,D-transpeptidase YcbB/YkuD